MIALQRGSFQEAYFCKHTQGDRESERGREALVVSRQYTDICKALTAHYHTTERTSG